jgi:archaellum biogenesis ATPase FlaH
MEKKVLEAAILSREAFEKLEQIIVPDDLGPTGLKIYEHVSEYYETDPKADKVDVAILLMGLDRTITNPKHGEVFRMFLNNLDLSTSAPNAVKELYNLRRENVATELAAKLSLGKHNEVDELIEQYIHLQGEQIKEETNIYQGVSIQKLFENVGDGNTIPLAPHSLNDVVGGGATPGHHIIVFARPEAGKTMFAINQAAEWLKLGYKVMYAGNEDPMDQTIVRLWSRLCEQPRNELFKNMELATDTVMAQGYANYVHIDMSPGTTREIEAAVAEHQPDVLIVDQVRNLAMGTNSQTEQLDSACKAMRNIGKKYGVVVLSITQAGESGKNKHRLEMDDVEYSNTGVAATADLMIGVGVDPTLEEINQRTLSIPKNKLTGTHPVLEVNVNPMLSMIA